LVFEKAGPKERIVRRENTAMNKINIEYVKKFIPSCMRDYVLEPFISFFSCIFSIIINSIYQLIDLD